MFLKPFKIKSKTAIKGSDRKRLRLEVGRQYASFPPDQLMSVIPNKEEMTIMKIMTHSTQNVTVYCLHKNPIFFEIEKQIYPTVYILWQFPDLLFTFCTWPEVFTKLVGGADLMLPGIIWKGRLCPTALGNLQKADACSVVLRGNGAPVAVGQTMLSSSDMVTAAMRGKGVKILHTYRDYLWACGDNSDVPFLEIPPEPMPLDNDDHDDSDYDSVPSGVNQSAPASTERSDVTEDHTEFTEDHYSEEVGESTEDHISGLSLEAGKTEERTREDGKPGEEECESSEDRLDYRDRTDTLLLECFLNAIKSLVKKDDLPLLCSKLFKVYMQPFCPPGERLDIKKSSYKKMSTFVTTMQDRGLVTVKQLTKGVDSVVTIHRNNHELRTFKPVERSAADVIAKDVSAPSQSDNCPQITEMFVVTTTTVSLFKACGHHRKGESFTQSQVRQLLTDYIRENEVRTINGVITLDPILSDVLLAKGEYIDMLPWEEAFTRCLGRMSAAYQITLPGQAPVVKKGHVNPITLSIVQRASSKKVTLIHNLETFGIDPEELAHNVQVNMACSSSVSPLPGKNQGREVTIQGNQINYISTLLIAMNNTFHIIIFLQHLRIEDKYHLPRKFIQGLEKAPKKGKKQR